MSEKLAREAKQSESAGLVWIADGDLAARVPEGGRDEFGRWAAEFNRIALSFFGATA